MGYPWMAAGMILLLLGGGRMPLHAPLEDAAYQAALRRIQEAAESNATALDLAQLVLTAVPPEIGQLTQLEYLDLHDNRLSALPPEIGQLTRLAFLDLSENQLTVLPPEIGQLTQISIFAVTSNRLSVLPSEIGQLT